MTLFIKQTKDNETTITQAFTWQQSLTLSSYQWDKKENTLTIRVRGVKDSEIKYGKFDLGLHFLLKKAIFEHKVDELWLENIHKSLPILERLNCEKKA